MHLAEWLNEPDFKDNERDPGERTMMRERNLKMKNMARSLLICILAGVALAGIIGSAAASIPLLPCEISGTVTINGVPAPIGAIVIAIVDGEEVARITVSEPGKIGGPGPFDERLVFQGNDDQIGSEISFLIHGYPADETVLFKSGEGFRIPITQSVLKGDLNANGRVDIGDVSRVAYMAIGLIEEELRGDFSYDGTVKAADAARIAYYYVGKIPAL